MEGGRGKRRRRGIGEEKGNRRDQCRGRRVVGRKVEGGPGSTFARLLLLNMHVKEESNLGMSTHKYSDSTLHKNGAILKNINRGVKQSHWELSEGLPLLRGSICK